MNLTKLKEKWLKLSSAKKFLVINLVLVPIAIIHAVLNPSESRVLTKQEIQADSLKRAKEIQHEEEQDLKTNALVIYEDFVKKKLDSPSTADFQSVFSASTLIKDSNVAIRSYVDHQNAFGATVRTNFIITLKHLGGSKADPNNWQETSFTAE
ncbi:MAG: hypothetical protein K2Q03_05005 [Sphingobacteriaceae bacterium]|nr:hypothetical protein [Sphingobacteriaceae bacterium]